MITTVSKAKVDEMSRRWSRTQDQQCQSQTLAPSFGWRWLVRLRGDFDEEDNEEALREAVDKKEQWEDGPEPADLEKASLFAYYETTLQERNATRSLKVEDADMALMPTEESLTGGYRIIDINA
jgi:hypothetical protein